MTTSPAQAKENFETFSRIVRDIMARWTYWQSLMDPEDPNEARETQQVLRCVADEFFKQVQWCLLGSVVLELAKLCDPDEQPTKGGMRSNLTLRRIFDETDFGSNTELRSWAERALGQCRDIVRSVPFLDMRNKFFAHNDLLTLTTTPPPGPEIKAIREAVDRVASFRERIESMREGKQVSISSGAGLYPPESIRGKAEVRRLVMLLRAGLQREREGAG